MTHTEKERVENKNLNVAAPGRNDRWNRSKKGKLFGKPKTDTILAEGKKMIAEDEYDEKQQKQQCYMTPKCTSIDEDKTPDLSLSDFMTQCFLTTKVSRNQLRKLRRLEKKNNTDDKDDSNSISNWIPISLSRNVSDSNFSRDAELVSHLSDASSLFSDWDLVSVC